jgi:uncharacterized protein YciI
MTFLRPLAILVAALFLASPAFAVDAPPDIRPVVFHAHGPRWNNMLHFREQEGVQDHVAYYGKAQADGLLSMGGPFLDDSGGMMIFKSGIKLETAQAFANDDPAVKSGLLIAIVRPWYVAMHATP